MKKLPRKGLIAIMSNGGVLDNVYWAKDAKGLAAIQEYTGFKSVEKGIIEISKQESKIDEFLKRYYEIKPKTQGMTFSDLTGGLITLLAKVADKQITQIQKIQEIKRFISSPKFKTIEKVKDRKLWIWEDIKKAQEFENNLTAGRKALEKGYDVFLLPNTAKGKSPDFILRKGNKYHLYECKTINGMASVGNRLEDAASQADRILLDIADKSESRMLAKELISFYERNPQIKDIMIFKGRKEFHISRQEALKKDFTFKFINKWAY